MKKDSDFTENDFKYGNSETVSGFYEKHGRVKNDEKNPKFDTHQVKC